MLSLKSTTLHEGDSPFVIGTVTGISAVVRQNGTLKQRSRLIRLPLRPNAAPAVIRSETHGIPARATDNALLLQQNHRLYLLNEQNLSMGRDVTGQYARLTSGVFISSARLQALAPHQNDGLSAVADSHRLAALAGGRLLLADRKGKRTFDIRGNGDGLGIAGFVRDRLLLLKPSGNFAIWSFSAGAVVARGTVAAADFHPGTSKEMVRCYGATSDRFIVGNRFRLFAVRGDGKDIRRWDAPNSILFVAAGEQSVVASDRSCRLFLLG